MLVEKSSFGILLMCIRVHICLSVGVGCSYIRYILAYLNSSKKQEYIYFVVCHCTCTCTFLCQLSSE